MTTQQPLTGERADILQILADQRNMLLITARGIGDAEAARRTTVSELTLGGLIKHVTACERSWVRLMTSGDQQAMLAAMTMDQHRMTEGETLAGLVADYQEVARSTGEAVAALDDLDRRVQLPQFPWAPPKPMVWSARFILLHIIRETAHHAGHADIIREALDGASTTMQRGAELWESAES